MTMQTSKPPTTPWPGHPKADPSPLTAAISAATALKKRRFANLPVPNAPPAPQPTVPWMTAQQPPPKPPLAPGPPGAQPSQPAAQPSRHCARPVTPSVTLHSAGGRIRIHVPAHYVELPATVVQQSPLFQELLDAPGVTPLPFSALRFYTWLTYVNRPQEPASDDPWRFVVLGSIMQIASFLKDEHSRDQVAQELAGEVVAHTSPDATGPVHKVLLGLEPELSLAVLRQAQASLPRLLSILPAALQPLAMQSRLGAGGATLDLANGACEPIAHAVAAGLARAAPLLPRFGAALSTLDLTGNKMGAGGARTLAPALPALPALATLRVGGNDLDDAALAALLPALPALTRLGELSLPHNRITAAGAEALVAALAAAPLEVLDLSYNGIVATTDEPDAGADGAPAGTLRDLRLGGNNVRSLALFTCRRPGALRRLRVLDLDGNNVYCADAPALAAALAGCPDLEVLRFGGNPVQSVGAAALAPVLGRLTRLHTLELGGCLVGPRGAVALAPHLACLGRLATLDLTGNNVGAAGAAAIAAHLPAARPPLTLLKLAYNRLEDLGVRAVAPALAALPSLSALDLTCNGINDCGAELLAAQVFPRLTGLTGLELAGNAFGRLGARVLAPVLQEVVARAAAARSAAP